MFERTDVLLHCYYTASVGSILIFDYISILFNDPIAAHAAPEMYTFLLKEVYILLSLFPASYVYASVTRRSAFFQSI